jgi:hypothetical protein
MTEWSTKRRPNRFTICLLAVALLIGSIGGINFVSAEVTSGDRPVFIPINPCRLVDTRSGDLTVGPKNAPIGPGKTITVTAHGANGECTDTSVIPTDAVSLSLNVTAVGPTSNTFLTFWGDGRNPGTSNLNPRAGGAPTPNSVNTPLSSSGTFNIYNDRGNVNVVVDVNGYYATHNHDDRYVRLDQGPSGSTDFRASGTVVTDSAASMLVGTSAPDGVALGIVRNGVGDYTLSLTGLDEALTAVVMLTAFGDATDEEARVCSLGNVVPGATSYSADIDCFGPDAGVEDISARDASFQFLILG